MHLLIFLMSSYKFDSHLYAHRMKAEYTRGVLKNKNIKNILSIIVKLCYTLSFAAKTNKKNPLAK